MITLIESQFSLEKERDKGNSKEPEKGLSKELDKIF